MLQAFSLSRALLAFGQAGGCFFMAGFLKMTPLDPWHHGAMDGLQAATTESRLHDLAFDGHFQLHCLIEAC